MNSQQIFSLVGSGCFGAFVGFILRLFIEKFETYDVKTLTAVLGVPIGSTLLVFIADFGPNSRPAYTIGLVLGLILYQAFQAKFPSLPMRHKRGALSVLDVSNVVTIHSTDGKKATWMRTQQMRFNTASKEALVTRLGGEGQIKPVKITSADGRVVTFVVRKQEVFATFTAEIKKGETVGIVLESEIADAFPTDVEWIEHEILQETFKLTMTVHLPAARRCVAAELSRVLGASQDALKQLPGGDYINVAVPQSMRVGESYRLTWQW